MTKTIRPDRVMAELIGTNYVRSLDDAIMVEHEPGCFESDSKSRKRVSEEDVKDVKPPVRTKPKRCNLEISRARIDLDTLARTRVTILGDGVSLRKARIDAAKTPFCDNVSSNETHGKKLIWSDATERWNIADLAEPASYRVILECYRVERPEKDYPEHTLWPRLPRNRGGPEKHLQSFGSIGI
jgi:hypothetical protein